MTVNGRGAWSPLGGTLNAKRTGPGPYYTNGVSSAAALRSTDPNVRAVHGGVVALQEQLNREGAHLLVDGVFGPATTTATVAWQQAHGQVADGLVGPSTALALLSPRIKTVALANAFPFAYVVGGIVQTESSFDPGAVGSADPNDLGLAQINGPTHPALSEADRLDPAVAYQFVIDYLENALAQLDNLDDAIASYNLGIGGARTWVRAGRPAIWRPTPTSAPRNVAAYIQKIKTVCPL